MLRPEATFAAGMIVFLLLGLAAQAFAGHRCGDGYRWDAERWVCSQVPA